MLEYIQTTKVNLIYRQFKFNCRRGWSALEALHWLISGFEYHLVSLVVSYEIIAECLSMRHIILRGQQGVYFSAWLCMYICIYIYMYVRIYYKLRIIYR